MIATGFVLIMTIILFMLAGKELSKAEVGLFAIFGGLGCVGLAALVQIMRALGVFA